MIREEIRISGYGGQGIITAGVLLAKAVALNTAYNVIQTQSYGPEARLGSCRADVIIAENRIYYPVTENPTKMVILSDEAFDKYAPDQTADSVVIVDTPAVNLAAKPLSLTARVKGYDITGSAEREFKSLLVTNMIALGVLVAYLPYLDAQIILQTIPSLFRPRFQEMNSAAFTYGLRLVTPPPAPAG